VSLLIAARHFDAQYSWNAHIAKAAEPGVSREALTELAESKEPQFTKRDEQLAYQFSAEILRDHFAIDETFAAALGSEFELHFTLRDMSVPKRVAIFASKSDHCLLDLLWRYRRGELPIAVRHSSAPVPTPRPGNAASSSSAPPPTT
jgi:hypothetical protein